MNELHLVYSEFSFGFNVIKSSELGVPDLDTVIYEPIDLVDVRRRQRLEKEASFLVSHVFIDEQYLFIL